MQQRRTPSGQGPRARGGRDVRGGARGSARAATTRSAASRTAGSDPSRSANRPAAARRATAGGSAKRTRAPQPRRLTGRAAVLCMLLVGLLLAYAYPVRVYLSQQNEIDQLEHSQTAQRRHIEELAGQLQKWNDDEYVKAQARGRLLFVMPGEKPLVVVGGQPKPGTVTGVPSTGAGGSAPWYGKLWSSIQTADRGAR